MWNQRYNPFLESERQIYTHLFDMWILHGETKQNKQNLIKKEWQNWVNFWKNMKTFVSARCIDVCNERKPKWIMATKNEHRLFAFTIDMFIIFELKWIRAKLKALIQFFLSDLSYMKLKRIQSSLPCTWTFAGRTIENGAQRWKRCYIK